MHRFRGVLAYVDAHAEEDLPVETLATVAGLSTFHFQRQFAAVLGIGVHQYVRLVRLHRASYRLAFRESSILEIALDSGYDSHRAFTRAFKAAFRQAPSEFRTSPDWIAWEQRIHQLHELRARQGTAAPHVRIDHLPQIRVTALEHRGDAKQLFANLRRFIAWRREHRLSPRTTATYNLVYGEEHLDLCVATTSTPRDADMLEKTVAGGRCAVLRHVGVEASLWQAVDWLYAEWLPANGETLRDEPLCLRRVEFFPDVPEHAAVTDVMLPLSA
jgi:AraC family transcriptional regulator